MSKTSSSTKMDIKVKRFDKSIELPRYDEGAACFDLICREATSIQPKEVKLVPLNIAVKIPQGFALLIFARSSTPLKKGLMLANSVGVIDSFYHGDKDEVLAQFFNFTERETSVEKGEVLAQGMVVKSESVAWKEVEEMGEEGSGGYKKDF